MVLYGAKDILQSCLRLGKIRQNLQLRRRQAGILTGFKEKPPISGGSIFILFKKSGRFVIWAEHALASATPGLQLPTFEEQGFYPLIY